MPSNEFRVVKDGQVLPSAGYFLQSDGELYKIGWWFGHIIKTDAKANFYTGYKDKHEVKIYEYDVVNAVGAEQHKDSSLTGVVKRSSDSLQFCIASGGYSFGLPLNWGGWQSIEIVGRYDPVTSTYHGYIPE